MAFLQHFSKLSLKARTTWILGLVILFALSAFLITGGNFYNKFAKYVATKTNETVLLPQVKEIPFNLGLDLQGGTQLIYEADMSRIDDADRDGAMESARDIIERRVNTFGISEPVVQANKGMSGEYRIIAELAGIKDVNEAIKMIGETPILEFKEQNLEALSAVAETGQSSVQVEGATVDTGESGPLVAVTGSGTTTEDVSGEVNKDETKNITEDDLWKNTELTGKY